MKTIAQDLLLRWFIADGFDAGVALNLTAGLLMQPSNMARFAFLSHHLSPEEAGRLINECPMFNEGRD